MEPNKKCWTTGNFCKTSASYLYATTFMCHLALGKKALRDQ